MSKWKPIKTAPKDGNLILIKKRHGRVQVASWEDPNGCGRYDWFVQLTQCGSSDSSHLLPKPASIIAFVLANVTTSNLAAITFWVIK